MDDEHCCCGLQIDSVEQRIKRRTSAQPSVEPLVAYGRCCVVLGVNDAKLAISKKAECFSRDAISAVERADLTVPLLELPPYDSRLLCLDDDGWDRNGRQRHVKGRARRQKGDYGCGRVQFGAGGDVESSCSRGADAPFPLIFIIDL